MLHKTDLILCVCVCDYMEGLNEISVHMSDVARSCFTSLVAFFLHRPSAFFLTDSAFVNNFVCSLREAANTQLFILLSLSLCSPEIHKIYNRGDCRGENDQRYEEGHGRWRRFKWKRIVQDNPLSAKKPMKKKKNQRGDKWKEAFSTSTFPLDNIAHCVVTSLCKSSALHNFLLPMMGFCRHRYCWEHKALKGSPFYLSLEL